MKGSSSKARLGNDGNLVISSSSNGGNIISWQSFDHPTNAYLPGAKNGYYNKITKKGQIITSWRNSEDPSEGIYSVRLDPDNSLSFLWNRSRVYYNSGVWNGHNFNDINEMLWESGYPFLNEYNYTSNENEMYFTYSHSDDSLPHFLYMDSFGQLKTMIWDSIDQNWRDFWSRPMKRCTYDVCGSYGYCNEFQPGSPICQCLPGFEKRNTRDWDLPDYSGGCVRKTSLQCSNKDRFLKMPSIKLSQIVPSANVFTVDSSKKCELACLQKCSCSAYAYYTNSSINSSNSIWCLLWHGDLLNIELVDVDANDLYIRLGSSMRPNTGTIVGVVLCGTTILLGIAFFFLSKWLRRRSTRMPEVEERYAFLTAFRFKDLKTATNNFSNKLGSGGFGSVFKGTLSDSTAIAVKTLEGFSQDQKQFRSEVSTIGLIQHVNLVRLRGFCSEGRKIMLVYDLMPNGSLDKYLVHQNNSRILTWQQRYQIATGVARGLAYLHEECRECIIHCDIKPENILLDAEFTPKVADFGLAKLLGREFSRVLTTMRGTIGYLAPEWTSGVAITAKADVYSYGKMLFEIISGRRNLKRSTNGKVCFFPTWAARKVISEGQPVLSILDNNLEGMANIEELTRAFRVACWCIQEEETQRPLMGQIVQILEGLLEVNPPPLNMYLHAMVEDEETANFFSE
ncbi:hypothetical protein Sjap_003530 [Stephania japonica]|uniref:non-specific serine/threonine protein kinase n=1 Tax=Stephania japonica TaxID=461633 RepID=A0AAP0KPW6_9MAGN